MNEAQFEDELRKRGYGEPQITTFEPNVHKEMHTHDFSAMVMVTSGELTVGYKDGSVTYGPGDWCEVEAGTPHSERAGSAGATALAGRK